MIAFSKLSIRLLLSALIGLMGLMLLGAVWPSFYASLTDYRESQKLEMLSASSAELFGALQNLRPERGNTLSALLADAPMTPKYANNVKLLRNTTESHYAQAEALLPKLKLARLPELLDRMKQAHEAMQTFRAQADANAVLPLSNRDRAFIAQSAELSGRLLSALGDVTDLVDAAIRIHDPVIDASLTVKREAWMVRNYAGERSLNAKTALGAGKAWTPTQSLAVAESRGQETASWRIVTELASRADAGPALRAAYAKALAGYFGQDQTIREAVYDALGAGRRPEMSLDAWLAHINPSLAIVGGVADGALTDMRARTDQKSADAFKAMLISGGYMGLSVLLTFSGLFVVRMRISQPIETLTQVMRRLAARDFTPSIPGTDRSDELGAMAKAVLVFRENGLTMQKLEADAAEQQRLAEAERTREEARRTMLQAQQKTVVESLALGLASLAQGDLTCTIRTEFAPDYERLRGDFNAALAALKAAVADVATHSATIFNGTQEIATASDDLAKRTEQQAAGLEQTAAVLQQITSTVRRTADGSQRARTVVANAAGEAKRSEQVVQDAVGAMSEIEASATQINQIIGVIDEIAFQTSLLALNAGVEAARAGESGRGFAVVASEVRALAQRSATAAKEIKSLISISTKQVGRGVALVDETRQALGRILSQIGFIGQVIGEIAASAQEQATSLIEVNSAVTTMDRVTQENAAMVEQTTAATHSLAHETEGLSRSTQRFRIVEVAPQAARAGRRIG